MGKVKTLSPLSPTSFPVMPSIAGIRLATGAAGIRYSGRRDLLLAVCAPGLGGRGLLPPSP